MVPRYNPVLLRRNKSRNSHTVVNYAPTSQGNFSRVVQKGCPRTTRSPLRYISARRDISLPHLQDKANTHNTTTVRTTLLQKQIFFFPPSSFFFKFNFNRSSDENFEQEVGVVGWRRSKAEPSSLQTDPISRKGQEKRRRGKRFLFKLIPQRPSRIPS